MLAESWPLLLFVFAGLFSPGPNVVMLTTSGARFGFRATVPHLLGVPVGTGCIAATSAFGIGAALLAAPGLKLAFQLLAAGWILWLAWRTAQAGRAGRGTQVGKPFSFAQAVLFQAVNPKIWAVTIAASAGFGIGLAPQSEALRLFIVFAGINLFVCIFWTLAGQMLARLLQSEAAWRVFMTVMAALMAATVVLIFL
ncbi:MAG: LysE family translocator [Pseudomonadota bacterium]